MKNLLIIDTETTGTDPAKDRVIEVAAILFSVPHATVLCSFSSLIEAAANPAEVINRIPPAALVEAPSAVSAWAHVGDLTNQADAFVAHGAEFDRAFSPPDLAARLPWICSLGDIQWPRAPRPGAALVATALAHDLGVAVAHRALADCDLIARLFVRAREMGADLDAMLARAMRPKALFQALVPFEEKDKARDAGFRWEPATRQWLRRMAIEDAATLGFKTRQV